ncbi:MAG: hypothetical protein M4579_001436 [Chaenotheca gracillima]|nr:MAG: hypothetical protein M4579_001436 [Chaenotheca gracillima]
MAIAKLLERRPHIVPGKYKVSELFFDVPKDYSKPDEETLRLFARSIQKYERPAQDPPEEEAKQLPWCSSSRKLPAMILE